MTFLEKSTWLTWLDWKTLHWILSVVACAAQAFRFPFIEPFERHFNESAYQKGVNFAYSGATAAITNALVPGFFLQREVDEYSKFTVKYPGESDIIIFHFISSYYPYSAYIILHPL